VENLFGQRGEKEEKEQEQDAKYPSINSRQ